MFTADPDYFDFPATNQAISGIWECPICSDRGFMNGWYGCVWDETWEKQWADRVSIGRQPVLDVVRHSQE